MISNRSNIIDSIDQLPVSDAVIIFGAHVTEDGEVTPLLKERLDAGKAIVTAGKSKKIVVSNTENAANIMAQYLQKEGVEASLIEIDTQAVKTTDTCSYEKKQHTENRSVIFVSQGFHLPRLLFQCQKIGIQGIAFPAEVLHTIDSSEYSFITKVTTRASRYLREAGLTWLAVLNIYK